jgi:transposase
MEIITGVERRRRWRREEKLQIVAETEQPGACFAEIARRYDVSRGLLWNWRSQARRGVLAPCPPVSFLPVRVVMGDGGGGARQASTVAPRPRDKQPDAASRIEIGLPDGTVVRVGSDVSAATLRRVMAAVRR